MDKIEFGKDHFLFSYKKNCGTNSYNDLVVIEYQKPYIVLYRTINLRITSFLFLIKKG